MLSAVYRDSAGDLVVRVIANRALRSEIEVDGLRSGAVGEHGRFAFVLDGGLEGKTATVTGIGAQSVGRSLEVPLIPGDIPAPRPSPSPERTPSRPRTAV